MQLGRSILGAVIGAAVGIGVLVAVYLAGLDSVWLSLAVAILTGLGVRMLVTTGGHASYLRGAITAAIALVAYLVGSYTVAGVMQANAAKASQPSRDVKALAADTTEPAEADKADERPVDEAPKAVPVAAPRSTVVGQQRPAMPRAFSALDFVALCIAGLIAYELGRGSGAAPPPAASDEPAPPSDAPQGAHPDA